MRHHFEFNAAAFVGGLDRWIRQHVRQQWFEVHVFSYEDGLGFEQLVSSLQSMYLKGAEWSNTIPIYIMSVDIATAFDAVGIRAVCKALQFWRVPDGIQAAFLREAAELEGTALLSGFSSDKFLFFPG